MGPEMRRILALPRREWDDIGELSPLLEQWKSSLWAPQLATLARLEQTPPPGAVYGDIEVGNGKFLIGFLAGAVAQAKRPVVFTYPDLIRQSHSEVAKFTPIFPEVAGFEPQYISHDLLSSQKRGGLLNDLAPDLIVVDEAHALCGRHSARTLRLLRYCVSNPATRVLILSGTLDRKTLEQIAHLVELALRDDAFLPLDPGVLRMWAAVLDHGAQPGKRERLILEPLCRWAGEADPLKAFRERYRTCPGVISPPAIDVKSSLVLHKWEPTLPKAVKSALTGLSEEWVLPDGSELVDSLEVHRHGSTLSLGFYYRPVPPEDLTNDEVEAWKEARRAWSRAVNLQIKYLRWPGLDSPGNVERAAIAGQASQEVQEAYEAWSAIRDSYTPTSEPVWVDRSLLEKAVRLVKSWPNGILWYSSSTALEPVLRELGLPVYGAGSPAPPAEARHVACSIRTHGTGKNLQAWDRQLILEVPASAILNQQLLGRTHRFGNKSDVVRAHMAVGSKIQKARLYAAISQAHSSIKKFGKKPKLVYCSWGT